MDWLGVGSSLRREFPIPWLIDQPYWVDLIEFLEQRILIELQTAERPTVTVG